MNAPTFIFQGRVYHVVEGEVITVDYDPAFGDWIRMTAADYEFVANKISENKDKMTYRIDTVKYYEMPYKEKDLAAKLIGKINWHFRDLQKHMMLIVPGRVGTTSPELGVPTAFSDISAFDIICETEEARAGYNPELSYGSHIFQDLVEAEILYTAVFHDEKTLHFSPEKLTSARDMVGEFDPDGKLAGIVHVYDVTGRTCEVYNDVANEHLLITC